MEFSVHRPLVSVIVPAFNEAAIIAENLGEFAEKLRHITNSSTFFHFFEARLRQERQTNDFSIWMTDMGERRLADDIDRIDPYSTTLEGLKQQIYVLCRRRLSER